MAYEKNTWARGDIVTSAKLNHMEDGIAGGTLVIGGFSFDENSPSLVGTSDKTWQEIDNALAAGAICVVVIGDNTSGHVQLIVGSAGYNAGTYNFSIPYPGGVYTATTTSADGYPIAGKH